MNTTKRFTRLWVLWTGAVCASLLMSGCAPESRLEPGLTPTPAATITPAGTSTSTPTPSLTPTLTPTSTPTGTPTPTPTATATPFPDLAVISPSVKLRSGPGELYPVVTQAAQGSLLKLRGQAAEGAWLLVELAAGEQGWVQAAGMDLASIQLDFVPVESGFPEPPPPITGWRGDPVEVVCLVLEGRYTGAYASKHPDKLFDASNPAYQEIQGQLEEYLGLLGLTAGSSGGCHATLTVNLAINQHSAAYTAGGTSHTCTYGVTVSGTITLSDGNNNLDFPSSKSRQANRPSAMLMSNCTDGTHFAAESVYLFLETAERWWGRQALALPLSKDSQTPADYYLTGYSLETIRSLGLKGKPYTPQLIACYNANRYHYPMGSTHCSGDCPTPEERWLRTMKAITGQDFQYDLQAWQDWWSRQNQ